MSAALLRRAAKVLRERAEGATDGPWTAATDDPEMCAVDAPSGRALVDVLLGDSDDRDEHPQADADAAYIALMHPPVAIALADWLQAETPWVDGGHVPVMALRVARAILREEQP
jgi:hypothetical protein